MYVNHISVKLEEKSTTYVKVNLLFSMATFFFDEVQLHYNVVFASDVQQSDCYTYIGIGVIYIYVKLYVICYTYIVWGFLTKLKIELPHDLALLGVYIQRQIDMKENANLKIYMHPNIHSSIIYNAPRLELPFGNHKFAFYVYEFVSILCIDSFVLVFRFHI